MSTQSRLSHAVPFTTTVPRRNRSAYAKHLRAQTTARAATVDALAFEQYVLDLQNEIISQTENLERTLDIEDTHCHEFTIDRCDLAYSDCNEAGLARLRQIDFPPGKRVVTLGTRNRFCFQ